MLWIVDIVNVFSFYFMLFVGVILFGYCWFSMDYDDEGISKEIFCIGKNGEFF